MDKQQRSHERQSNTHAAKRARLLSRRSAGFGPILKTTALVAAVLCGMLGAAGAIAGAASSRERPVDHKQPKITGEMVSGRTIHAWLGSWRGARRLSLRWERCSAAGGRRCKVVMHRKDHGKPRPVDWRRYRIRKADVGHRIRVIVRAENARGVTTASSRATRVIKRQKAGAGSTTSTNPTSSSAPSADPTKSASPTTSTSTTTKPATTTSTTPSTKTTPTTTTATTATPTSTSSTPVSSVPAVADPGTLVPSSEDGSPPAGIPRSDAACAAAVTPSGEKRPANATANNTVPTDPSSIAWNPGYKYWPAFVSDRDQVTGDYKGTTDEIIQWAACKWGLDVNEARAEAWYESGWNQSLASSSCGGAEATFGLFQIMAEDCSGDLIHGGYPYVADDTALNADYWAAWIRACFDGAFLDSQQPASSSPAGGYNGQTMAQVIAANGEQYALYGCVGAWAQNAWYTPAAQAYINTVKQDEQTQLWLQPGT